MVGDQPDQDPTRPKKRIDPEKIPDRAWAAADYLRSRVLDKNPAAVAGVKPWEYGHVWTAGAGDRVGDGSRTGLRLAWANEFRLFHQRLHAAMKNANAGTKPEDAWVEIARTVHWLFHSQPDGVQFIVESPGSLAAKWDRIQEIRRDAKSARGNAKGVKSAPIRPKYTEEEPPLDMTRSRK